MSERMKSAIAAGLFVLVALFACIALGYYFGAKTVVVQEQAPTAGATNITPVRAATSSSLQLGPQQNKTLFALNQSCGSRIVATAGQGIMLAFDGVSTPGASIGHWQPASTTVAYQANVFGCGPVTGYAGASTTVTITETNR